MAQWVCSGLQPEPQLLTPVSPENSLFYTLRGDLKNEQLIRSHRNLMFSVLPWHQGCHPRVFRKLVSQHIPTVTNADVLVRRAIKALLARSGCLILASSERVPGKTAFPPAQSNHPLQHLFSRSHKTGCFGRHQFTAIVAASLHLLDATEFNFNRSKRPAPFSQSSPGERLPRRFHAPPCQPVCRHTKQTLSH